MPSKQQRDGVAIFSLRMPNRAKPCRWLRCFQAGIPTKTPTRPNRRRKKLVLSLTGKTGDKLPAPAKWRCLNAASAIAHLSSPPRGQATLIRRSAHRQHKCRRRRGLAFVVGKPCALVWKGPIDALAFVPGRLKSWFARGQSLPVDLPRWSD